MTRAKMCELMASREQDHHDHFSKCAELHEAQMKRCEEKDDKDGMSFHKAMTATHRASAEKCLKTVQALNETAKAIDAELSKVRPDGISSVAFGDSPETAFGFRAVPRAGAPTVGELTKAEIDAVDPRFRHLVEIGE